jgi:hypothetical protein
MMSAILSDIVIPTEAKRRDLLFRSASWVPHVPVSGHGMSESLHRHNMGAHISGLRCGIKQVAHNTQRERPKEANYTNRATGAVA